MNKQGFIKTVEAIIAVLIIFIFIYYITPKSTGNKETNDIKELQAEILKGISENEVYRECIVSCPDGSICTIEKSGISNNFNTQTCTNNNNIPADMKGFIEKSLTPKFKDNYQLVICTQGNCGSPPEKDTVYTSAVIVTSSLKTTPPTYNPKVVRLYLW
ncbi:MAG: hypothetical protein AABX29_00835 [Nanoarchaeota archaeon]